MKRILFLILFCFNASLLLQAQTFEAGGWLGAANYFGDINTNLSLKNVGPSGGVLARYNFNDRIALKFSANYAKLGGYDSDSNNEFQKARNLSFESHVIDGAVQFEFHFLKFIHGSDESFYTPYIFGGPALFYFNPRAKYEGEWHALQPLGTEGQFKNSEYALIQPSVAYGIGLKLDLNVYWSLNFEVSGRALFTDFLDDVSGLYADRTEIANIRSQLAADLSDRSIEINEVHIGELGRQRGDSVTKDKFVMIGLSLVYNFSSVKCPGF